MPLLRRLYADSRPFKLAPKAHIAVGGTFSSARYLFCACAIPAFAVTSLSAAVTRRQKRNASRPSVGSLPKRFLRNIF